MMPGGKNKMSSLMKVVTLMIVAIVSAPVLATPPAIWVDPIPSHTLIAGNGEGTRNLTQALGFSFPYKGGGSTNTITIGSHGGIALAAGETLANDIWTNTAFESNFSAEGTPRILVFSTGLNHAADTTADVEGVYFNSDGNTAIVTWYRIAGIAATGTALISAQVQLRDDGTIIFGYDAEAGANFLTSLNSGIVVGISNGMSVWPTGSTDFSVLDTNDINAGTTNYQIWCRNNNVAGCFQQNGTDTHESFDLDGKNIVFNPTSGVGYQISKVVTVGVDAGACLTLSQSSGGSGSNMIASIDTGGSGGGGGGGAIGIVTFLFLAMITLFRSLIMRPGPSLAAQCDQVHICFGGKKIYPV
jgi:hypothetical protein